MQAVQSGHHEVDVEEHPNLLRELRVVVLAVREITRFFVSRQMPELLRIEHDLDSVLVLVSPLELAARIGVFGFGFRSSLRLGGIGLGFERQHERRFFSYAACLFLDLLVQTVERNESVMILVGILEEFDDQERRAHVATERQLAENVLAHELFLLERAVQAFMDDGKAAEARERLLAAELQEIGTERAAQLIDQEVQK